MPYDHMAIEANWQAYWEEHKTFKAEIDRSRPKLYILDMFPYPSGDGLHVGHPEGYTASDILARYKRMRGFNVLHPFGWDAFGLPAENYALKTGTHPAATTRRNIEVFRRQTKSLGFSIDWDREIDTTDPAYYRWTQWIFLRLYERGLAYQAEVPINWCESCRTGLANEEVKEGVCERCGGAVVKRRLRQWLLKITAYADRLLEDLDDLDWPEGIKEMQRNWIGKSHGAEVSFPLAGGEGEIRIYTTRPDTLYGATYMVLAPEHPLVDAITAPERRGEVARYVTAAAGKSDLDRTDLMREKTGVFTGGYAVNPVNGERIPVWISDYVLLTYGTGAIMAVPAHDQRDWEFATRYELPIVEVVSGGDISQGAHEGDGILVNSPVIDGLAVAEAKQKMTRHLEERGIGQAAVNYKLRDWIFSRQRYWGEPFPVLHLENGAVRPLGDDELPLTLPELERYEPSGTGESPLANAREWIELRDPATGMRARREANTMPQWAGSCWYYLRFLDPRNDRAPFSPEAERYWMPVDIYVGGAEHAVLHLLYARFWHKVLFDAGVVSTKEPFARLINQGMILGEDSQKMSKSRGNVINPDDIVRDYGADSMRLYEMFMGPLETVKPWNTRGVVGVHKFLNRVWSLVVDEADAPRADLQDAEPEPELLRALHRAVRAVTEDVEAIKFNTAIARMMELTNLLVKASPRPRSVVEGLVLLLSPFAPHIAEELWRRLGHEDTLAYEPWPEYDPQLVAEDVVTIPVQVAGKVRDRIDVPRGTPEARVRELVLERERVRKFMGGRELKKFVYVQDRMVNIVVT